MPEAEPKSFKIQPRDAMWFFNMELERPIDAVRVEAENLIFGEMAEWDLVVAAPYDHADDSVPVTVFPTTVPNQLRIGMAQERFGDGIWFVRFYVREEGRDDWLPLIDSSGESYATCIASTAYTRELASEDIVNWCPQPQRARAFLRLSRAIETPIAPPCRRNMVDLARAAWQRVGKSLDTSDPTERASLLKSCALPPSPHAHESWIPVRHPVEINPNVFALPAEDIGELGSSEVSGYEEFESIGLAGLTESLQDAVDLLDVSVAFLTAFEKASALQRDPDASPGAFDFSKYCEYARTMTDIAEDDKPLSVWHHGRACERMADRVTVASQDPRAANRLLRATTLVHHFRLARTERLTESLETPRDLADGFPLVQGAPRLIATLTRAWRCGDTETFWKECASAVSWPREKVQKCVGTVLRLAPELVAFYLLLWVLAEEHETA
ncbi:hypothetical protein [Candidatus Palauibacter sp.]|uniref:hypothetical protein n=1 Tax=Candidatus Palauibacter sp. TaxID=3101350 RepID=UPI003B01D9ED